jgi:hypothetical protein
MVMKFNLQNPRGTATADMKLEDGSVLQVTVEAGATQETVLASLRQQVVNESARRQGTGGVPLVIPTVEDLIPALKLFAALAGDQEIVP